MGIFWCERERLSVPYSNQAKVKERWMVLKGHFGEWVYRKMARFSSKSTIYDPKSMGPENMPLLIAIIIPQHIILKVNLKKQNRIKSEQNAWL